MMDLFDVGRACVRRWYVTLPLLLVTVLLSSLSYLSVETKYYGTTVLGVAPAAPPNSPAAGGPSNGLMDTGGIGLVSNLVALGLQDDLVRRTIEAKKGLPTYETGVYSVPGGQLPLVNVTVSGPDSEVVARTLDLVTEQSVLTLREVQDNAGVVEVAHAKTYQIRPPGPPEARKPQRARTTVAVFVIGLGLSVLGVIVVDSMIRRPRRRATEGAEPDHLEHTVAAGTINRGSDNPARDDHQTVDLPTAPETAENRTSVP
jgi:hypothetical protein